MPALCAPLISQPFDPGKLVFNISVFSRIFSRACPDLKMPDQVQDGFIRVEDKIYSAEKLANFHPGGPIFVKVTYLL